MSGRWDLLLRRRLRLLLELDAGLEVEEGDVEGAEEPEEDVHVLPPPLVDAAQPEVAQQRLGDLAKVALDSAWRVM